MNRRSGANSSPKMTKSEISANGRPVAADGDTWNLDKVNAWAYKEFKDDFTLLPAQAALTFKINRDGCLKIMIGHTKPATPTRNSAMAKTVSAWAVFDVKKKQLYYLIDYVFPYYSNFHEVKIGGWTFDEVKSKIDFVAPFSHAVSAQDISDGSSDFGRRMEALVRYYSLAIDHTSQIQGFDMNLQYSRQSYGDESNFYFLDEFKAACTSIAEITRPSKAMRGSSPCYPIVIDDSDMEDDVKSSIKHVSVVPKGLGSFFLTKRKSETEDDGPRKRHRSITPNGMSGAKETKTMDLVDEFVHHEKPLNNLRGRTEQGTEDSDDVAFTNDQMTEIDSREPTLCPEEEPFDNKQPATADLQQQNIEQKSQIANLQGQLSQQGKAIETLNNWIETFEALEGEYDICMSDLEKRELEQRTTITEQQATIKEQQAKILELEGADTVLKERISKQADAMAELRSENDNLENIYVGIYNELAQQTQSMQHAERTIVRLRGEGEDRDKRYLDRLHELRETESKLQVAEARAKKAESKLKNMSDEIQDAVMIAIERILSDTSG